MIWNNLYDDYCELDDETEEEEEDAKYFDAPLPYRPTTQ
jgi:hypothetical protein